MTRRLPIIVVLVGSVVLALLVDRGLDDTPDETGDAVIDASVFPVASEPSDLSSTWYCAGGTADEESFADHRVVIANPTDTAVTATMTAYPGVVAPPVVEVDPEDLDDDAGGEDEAEEDPTPEQPAPPEPVTHEVEIEPQGSTRVRLGDLVQAPIVSALVESDTGGVIVEHQVRSIHGFDAKPCATSAASEWHFAWGNTTVNARELLVLFNPYPQDAIVEGRFSTEDGVREPGRFESGLVVPARGTVAVDLGDDVTRRREVAATITARSGRIVVDRILRIDNDAARGLTVQLGVPEPATTWIFPDGFRSERVREQFAVYNPGDEVAEVEITFSVDDPQTNGIPEPVDLSLAPGAHEVVDINEDGRVPARVGHTASVRSANGVPVVAERVLASERDSRKGLTVTTGSPVEAQTWTFAAGAATDTRDEYLMLVNLDPRVLTQVDVVTLAGGQRLPLADLQDIELSPGERRVIPLDESTGDSASLPIVVQSTEPIVAERGLYAVGADARGMSNAIGVPSPDGLRPPIDPTEVATEDAELDEPDAPEGDGGTPEAPDDVELPEPDETIVIEDPDAPADAPAEDEGTTTEPEGTTTEPDG